VCNVVPDCGSGKFFSGKRMHFSHKKMIQIETTKNQSG
jgi:hypothetical protein